MMLKTLIAAALLLIALPATGIPSGGFVIDPGHSPKSPGATSCTGRPEYLYNEALAGRIAAYLAKKGLPAPLTHGPHEERSLRDRAQAAAGKRLIISIHHDSVQPQFLTWSGGKPQSAKAQGFSIFVSGKNGNFEQSLRFAQKLGKALIQRGYTPSLHHAERIPGENRQLVDAALGIYLFDDLVVLKNAPAPALLLEAAVIVNPQDEERARSEGYQAGIAEAVAEAVQ